MSSLIDTDFERNIKRVQPFLGLLLVLSVGLLVYMVVHRSAEDLATSLSGAALDVHGSILLANRNNLHYGDVADVRATVFEDALSKAQDYITVACFQADELVYQDAAQDNARFILRDLQEPGFDWNGEAASCTASLIYRVANDALVEQYILDTVSFDVDAR